MTAHFRPNRLRRLLVGTSIAAVASGLGAMPAEAQLARLRANAGTPTTLTAPTVSIPVRPTTMREALARTQALQTRADQIRGYVTSARDAALAATRTKPADGLSAGGLDPIAAVREAAALRAQGGEANLARADTLMASVSAANDATGLATWQGAGAPVQTSADGRTQVTITQTQDRALLSWNRFDIGAGTTLTFDQKLAGVAQPGWTVVNRIVNSIAPSTILGSVKADGTVLVLNSRGVIFGQGAQVNLQSLLVSSLEIGNYGRNFRDIQLPGAQVVNVFDATTLKDRNTEYLQNGLFAATQSSGTLPPLVLSPLYETGTQRTDSTPELEGDVIVDSGATITAGAGGFVILAGPTVTNAGSIIATEGQASLQGGRLIAATRSTGAATSVDGDVRGLILRTIGTVTSGTERRSSAATALGPTPDDGRVVNSGLIQSNRGYLSLGAGLFGSVANNGLLASTTSVSRNGKISLTAGTVSLGGSADVSRAGGIVILPDGNGETIPQGTADAPASFKTSVVEIGARADDSDARGDGVGIFIPSVVSFGENSILLAPSATVTIGRDASTAFDPNAAIRTLSGITLASGAAINVGGVKDVQLAASRNSLQVTPVKRNELRDTPNYREVSLTGDFTLNGATLYIDPRRSGVRADGVRWIGSPLIEAGSLASQIGVTAAELMTKGGTVSLGVNLVTSATDPAAAPRITIARGATIDVSGGWVHYNEGAVRTSNLVTSDGRIVNIGDADPNDIFVGVAEGFTEYAPRSGASTNNASSLLDGVRFETGYDEGRDAGALVIGGSAITVDGALYGDAFAGIRQTAKAVRPSVAATIAQDSRALQRSATDLPSGGYVRIGSLTGATGVGLGGDIAVVAPGDTSVPADGSVTRLDATMLSGGGFSALSLQTSGAVRFGQGSALSLADGGTLRVDAGRQIDFDGSVRIAGGSIAARTYELSRAPIATGSITALGSAFRSDDDLAALYAVGTTLLTPFDINVTGTLSTAGRWVNDSTGGYAKGSAFTDGGAISLTVAPKVFVALGETLASATDAGDLSGRLTIADGALLDVSAGGYVAPNRTLDLDARGGDIALVNETTYASTVLTVPPLNETAGRSDAPIAGSNQSVDFTPDDSVVPALVPTVQRAGVSFSESSLKGFGFTSGGTFSLVAPQITFESDTGPGAHLSLEFFRNTGFGTLSATTFRSRTIFDLFTNGRAGNSAFFETTTFRIAAGETLDLTQSLLPRFLSAAQAGSLLSLATDSDVRTVLTPGVPDAAFDRVAANLTLGGLTELDIAAGGQLLGAAGALVTAPKILNEGVIRLPGGTIAQRDFLPINLVASGLGLGLGGLPSVLGPIDNTGRFDENAANAAGIVDPLDSTRLVTNRELFARADTERFLYFLGALGQDEGIRLAAGSVTDLSGVSLVNTRAPYLPSGAQLLTGRVVSGGTISTATQFTPPTNDTTRTLFSNPVYGNVRYLNAADNTLPAIVGVTSARTIGADGATVDLSGASASFDQLVTSTSYARMLQWSDGGRLTVGGGGSVFGARIDARGGAAAATGGTLDWLRPTIVQRDGAEAVSGTVAAARIMAAGFDTVNALGGVTFDGAVSLTLGKAFTVQSIPTTTGVAITNEAQVTVSATAGTDASVIAPFVRFASRLGTIPAVGAATEAPDARVAFTASAGIDFSGGVLFDLSIASASFTTPGDIRFIGVDDRRANSTELPSLDGTVIGWGDLLFDGARTYATTGTGNLQRFLEDRRASRATTVSPFLVAALGESAIRFGGTYLDARTPLSAGSYLKIAASEIEQNGYLAAPLGLLEIGLNDRVSFGPVGPFIEPTTNLTFGAGSVTTVSGAGGYFPYGTTTDLTEYFFSPSVGLPLTTLPIGQLSLAGATIDIAEGSKIDGRGGGDVFAFEFVSGTGGSRDVLDRFNRDAFSSNGYDPITGVGYQFADQRQVYAIVPADQARAIAAYDPLYSADYQGGGGGDLYGAQLGLAVTLDAAPGVAGGEYVLLPAHYALLPGALRVVENTAAAAPAPGGAQVLRDGSIVVGGTFSTAGTGLSDSQRRSFTVQTRDTFLSYSRIETTGGSATIAAQAVRAGLAVPRLPLDAARVVLSPLNALTVNGLFDTTAAAGGRGAEFDIAAERILIAGTIPADAPRKTLLLTDDTLARLNATSLLIGGERQDNLDGTTNLGVIAKAITVAADTDLTVLELLLTVGGVRSELLIEGGARLTATGSLGVGSTGNYIIPSLENPAPTYRYDPTGIGAALRLAVGPDRLFLRDGATAAENTTRPATLRIGAATLTGDTLSLDSSLDFIIADRATLATPSVAISGDRLRFGDRGVGAPLLDRLAQIEHLTLRTSGILTFDAGRYAFRDLTLDTAGIGLTTGTRGALQLDADTLTFRNSGDDLGACTGSAALGCGGDRSRLTILADTLVFGSGMTRTYGIGGAVSLTGSAGAYYEGKGGFDAGVAALTIATPFLVDRATEIDPRDQAIRPDYRFSTTGDVVLTGVAGSAATPAGPTAPGAKLAFGTGAEPARSITITDTKLRATAGTIDLVATRDIVLGGTASLDVPGYTRTFGDAVDSVTVSAGAGAINLVALRGNLSTGAETSMSVDNGVGAAGSLGLYASNGRITLASRLNPGATGIRDASFAFDSGETAFDLGGFVDLYGQGFGGDLSIRSGLGDLALDTGDTIRARSVSLTADGGAIAIGGTIDTSGVDVSGLSATDAATARVNGGTIALYGRTGVTLGATARLDTHTNGYSATDTRSASAGDVAIGIGDDNAAITLAAGALIDAGARRLGNRLVAQTVKDPFTLTDTTVYRYAAADIGGTVSLRAPMIGQRADQVDIRLGGTIAGAASIEIEGVQRYDLDALAASGLYSGITPGRNGRITLDFAADRQSSGLRNILTENFARGGVRSLVNFIQNFSVSALDGSDLTGIRLRPGVDLVSTESITFGSNWNLGAGTLDQEAAIAAGLLQIVPQLGLHEDGTPYYAVAPGREAELFQDHVTMLYRVGGRVDGEAAVVTVQARGDLNVEHSISDGFFSFRDATDPGYMSYQLGGGDRTVQPAALFGCGSGASGDCSQVGSFDDILNGTVDLNRDSIATISLGTPVAGSDRAPGILAPYSALANGAVALGSGKRNLGDPLGSADLFPLLADGSRGVRSTSLRLVGGADAAGSANPLHVDRASGGTVAVTGETSYTIEAKTGTSSYAGRLQLRLRPNPGSVDTLPVTAAPRSFINAVANSSNGESLDPELAGDYYTVLDWGSTGEIADTTRDRAIAFFAANFPRAQYQGGSAQNSTGIAAPLSAIIAFLQAYGAEYARKIENGAFDVRPPTPTAPASLGRGGTAYVGTVVRTGDGSISVAAANTVDLRRTPDFVYRNALGTSGSGPPELGLDPTNYQVGGTAIYTAGRRLAQQAITAAAADGTSIVFTPTGASPVAAFDALTYQPSNRGQFFQTPRLLVGGGDVSIFASGGDVLGRRDVWAEQNLGTGSSIVQKTIGRPSFRVPSLTFVPDGYVGAPDQVWRVGSVGQDTEIATVPNSFTAGLATLGGGDVTVRAGGSVIDLTLAVDTGVTTADPAVPVGTPVRGAFAADGPAARPVMLTFGGGNASVIAGRDLLGGQFDIASGQARVSVGGDVASFGRTVLQPSRPIEGEALPGEVNGLRLRVADATIAVSVLGEANVGGIGALGVRTSVNSLVQDNGKGFFSAAAGVSIAANGLVTLDATRPELRITNFSNLFENSIGYVLPPSLSLVSTSSDVAFGGDVPRFLFPSLTGQLSLIAGGEIRSLALIMSDSDASLLPGAFTVRRAATGTDAGLDFGFNGVFPSTTDAQLRLFHNERPTHADDAEPLRIFAGESITDVTLSLPKQARIGAGLDIVDMVFTGQNVRAGDVTRIAAGRDIIGTTRFSNSQRLPYINGNSFTLGGYGALSMEAGRDLGPFLNSATVTGGDNPGSFAGGVRTVGNDLNPWLNPIGADVIALFGVAKGVDYAGLQATYLDPANLAGLDGDLFVQVTDGNGNESPDRTRPIYAPILADWLRVNAPDAYAAILGGASGETAAAQSYARYGDLYAAFARLDNLTRRSFLIDQVYFNELAQTSLPTGPSFQQYIRGYRAQQTLFPVRFGYTDNLATYATDPATIDVDHPLGQPTKIVVDGQPLAATRVLTGDVDLRLATIETTRGGGVTILGPGGSVLAGSVVRTSDQAARRATLFGIPRQVALENGLLGRANQLPIAAIPIGFEGVLTLRGGAIRSATDGSFLLNQSRLFTLAGGDITLWSSNGDLNAGQGPRSASAFPPVTVRFDQNGLAEVDSAGSVSGAGIGAFKQTPSDPESTIILVAPVGSVDAGDAGVRASGNVFVAAARVSNADNFSAGGDISGVPSATSVTPATPANAASSVVGQLAKLANASANDADRRSLISVDVLGYLGNDDRCDDPNANPAECVR